MRKPKTARPTSWHHVVRKITRQKSVYEESKGTTLASRIHHYVVDSLYILANILFIVGSYDFFDDVGDSVLGAWMFIFGSTIVAGLSILSLVETYVHHSHAAALKDEEGGVDSSDEDDGVVVCSPVSQMVEACGGMILDESAKREVEEESLYLASSLVFMAGCWLGYVQKRQTEGEREHWEALSVWLFIVGSFGFLMGSFYNALGLNTHGTGSRTLGAKLSVYALLCGLVGSVFFFTGSYLYRPALATGCTESEAEEQEESGEVGCVTASQTGTWLYVLGSAVFLVQSLLNLTSAILKHREEARALSNSVLFSTSSSKGRQYGAVPVTTPQFPPNPYHT